MRTNIEIDDALIGQAMQLSGAKTKRDVVARGLEEVVRRERQRQVLKNFGKMPWDGDLDDMRTSKHIEPDGPTED